MSLQITISFKGAETVRVFNSQKILIGRKSDPEKPDLDLSEDVCVSRQHALLEVKNGAFWLRDLDSKFGTQVNGREIRGQGQCRLLPEDTVVVGETTLRVAPAPAPSAPAEEATIASAAAKPLAGLTAPQSSAPEADVRILRMIDTNKALVEPGIQGAPPAQRRLKMLLDMPRQFSAQATSNDLLQTVINRVVEVIPAARRGALLLRNPRDDSLLLKAYVSADQPAVSEMLTRRAVAEKRGFIWRSAQGVDPTRSVLEFRILSGMYAPVQWHDHVFGVICVDSPVATDAFTEDDLQFLIAIGLYAGMALAELQNLSDMKKQEKLAVRLLANFSPKIRAMLLDQALNGKLRPGGAKSEVSILFCDISGFTRQAARMDAQDVVEMLNHYFQPIIEAIFRFDGTVDKFVGDAVLAVFGCPQPDPEQHAKAVRAAVAIQEGVQATTHLRATRGDETCALRIRVHCGEVFQGFVGANDRLEFTVIGDPVNRARRICDAAGDGEVLISHEVFQRVYNIVRSEKSRIQTKEGELEAHLLTGLRS